MKYNFEINTTVSKPIFINVDSEITSKDLTNKIMEAIEDNTILYKDEILDIFTHDTLNNDTLSLPSDDSSVESMIAMNRNYFPVPIKTNHFYKLFVIDRMYRERLSFIDDDDIERRKQKQINTSHNFGHYFNRLKNMFQFI